MSKELISRADAIAIAMHSKDPVEGIKNLPAADAVEAVRCYQCKHYLKSPMICEREDGLWAPDKLDYCSFGERWDGE